MHWEQLLRANHGKVRGICSSHMLLTNNRIERAHTESFRLPGNGEFEALPHRGCQAQDVVVRDHV